MSCISYASDNYSNKKFLDISLGNRFNIENRDSHEVDGGFNFSLKYGFAKLYLYDLEYSMFHFKKDLIGESHQNIHDLGGNVRFHFPYFPLGFGLDLGLGISTLSTFDCYGKIGMDFIFWYIDGVRPYAHLGGRKYFLSNSKLVHFDVGIIFFY